LRFAYDAHGSTEGQGKLTPEKAQCILAQREVKSMLLAVEKTEFSGAVKENGWQKKSSGASTPGPDRRRGVLQQIEGG
jgi:hypothetical protein